MSVAMDVETKFLRLEQPVRVGDPIDGWRVCWLGGWDKGRMFFIVMVEKQTETRRRDAERKHSLCLRRGNIRCAFGELG
jgi:hypothetical protein